MPDEATVSTPALSLHISSEGATPVIQCAGKITVENTDFLKAQVRSRLQENGRLILDLSDVSFMDSSGLGAIVALYLSARGKHCGLELINLSQQIRKLFAMTSLLSIFETCGREGIRFP